MTTEQEYQIGRAYRLKLNDAHYRVTLIDIDRTSSPPRAHVIIREHSVDSFRGLSSVRKRHTKKSETVPCTDVPLNDLLP
jgi:hypothetical protein